METIMKNTNKSQYKLITPSSVSGSGVSLNGSQVVFTAATSVSVNGVFSTTYDNYLVVFNGVSNTSDYALNFRLRASGSDASGSNYTYQRILADSTSVTGARTSSQTNTRVGTVSASLYSGSHIYLYGPALAQPTAIRNVDVEGVSSARIADYASTHSLLSIYDGFTIYPNENAINGALTVYGLSQ
jgi:hypothetical protein